MLECLSHLRLVEFCVHMYHLERLTLRLEALLSQSLKEFEEEFLTPNLSLHFILSAGWSCLDYANNDVNYCGAEDSATACCFCGGGSVRCYDTVGWKGMWLYVHFVSPRLHHRARSLTKTSDWLNHLIYEV